MRAPRLRACFAPAVSVATALAAWELLCRLELVNTALLPPPSTIFPLLWDLVESGSFLGPLASSLGLLLVGYTIACGLGVGLGLLMGCSDAAYCLFEPLVELIRPIPKPALVPALFLFFGIGPTTMLIIISLAALFPVLINTMQAVKGIDPVLLSTARTFRCSRSYTVFRVILPAAMPLILTGMRVSLGLGLVLVVLAEMLAGENGLGFTILDMERSFRIVEMYAWVVILAIVGLALAFGFELLETRVVPWRGT